MKDSNPSKSTDGQPRGKCDLPDTKEVVIKGCNKTLQVDLRRIETPARRVNLRVGGSSDWQQTRKPAPHNKVWHTTAQHCV
ncbi:hypothetical protein GCM10027093_20020 [Paraburkholderia jirisanensis]